MKKRKETNPFVGLVSSLFLVINLKKLIYFNKTY